MPKLTRSQPKYRRHNVRNIAFVTIGGKRHYLPGAYGSKESREAYLKKMLLWERTGRPADTEPLPDELSIAELLVAFLEFAQRHYVKNGRQTDEVSGIKLAIKPLYEMFSELPAAEFGPKKLVAAREWMITEGWSRNTINQNVSRIRRIFRWAVAQEMLPETVHRALTTIQGLQRGRTQAIETEPVGPVDLATVEATIEKMSKIPADMVRLQLATGMRPSEVCNLRPCDVNRTGEVWTYRPSGHKMFHKGRDRVVYLGPKAQAILRPYLLRGADAYCFSPRESEARRLHEKHARRTTPAEYGNCPGSNRKARPTWSPGDHYAVDAYRRAITRAADAAHVEPWAPNRLRHTAATLVRDQFGIEAVQAILGHSELSTTQIYAEKSERIAMEVAKAVG